MKLVLRLHVLIAAVALMSVAVNLLLLASPLYMLQVFDRVLSGRSVETLLFLSLIVLAALLVMGALDACRSVVLARFGDWLDRRLGPDVMAASVEMAARPGATPTTAALADLAAVRQFLSSPGVGALFDAPWMPLFIALIWVLHPILGAIALGSALLLMALAVTGEIMTRRLTERAGRVGGQGHALMETTLANADLVQTMGLRDGLRDRWVAIRDAQNTDLRRTAERVGTLSSFSKALRLIVQSTILGAGAFLVLQRELSPGEMIAASIVLSRALAPVEVAIGSWRQFVSARFAWRRIVGLLQAYGRRPQGLELPAPKGRLTLDKVTVAGGRGAPPMLQGISLDLPPGEILGVMGPSGSGKSTLGRLLVGAWVPTAGTVRLDGAELAQWDRAALGAHVGYLPQSIDLFAGTVRDNIARFTDAPLDQVIAAARRAGAEETILKLPEGYETEVGMRGERLSGGQRQRIALARALFGAPCLLVLDEPDSNLDQTGNEALVAALGALRAEGVTVVVIAHRRGLLGLCDKLLWLEAGQPVAFGPARKVIERFANPGKAPLRAVSGGGERE